MFGLGKRDKSRPVTVLGTGFNVMKRDEVRPIELLDADRTSHFWCFGTTRVGKAQPLDALVHTPEGWKTMGEIRKGSVVSTPEGGVARVLEVFPQGVLPVYKVTFEDGRSAEASGEHLWAVCLKGWNRISRYGDLPESVRLTTEQIKEKLERGVLGLSAPLCRAAERMKQDLPTHPYDFGCSVGTGEKSIPACYLDSCIQDRLELLKGILSTAGAVSRREDLYFGDRSEDLVKSVQELVWSLGCKAQIKREKGSFTLSIEGRDSQGRMLGISSVEYVRDAECQCILLDSESHLYITNNYVVTHNTRLLENMVEQDIRKGNSVVIIDPKGDAALFAKVVQIAAEEDSLDDLMFMSAAFPEHSVQVNPLEYYYMPEELVGIICAGIMVGKEPFFRNVAMEITSAIVQSFICIAKANKRRPVFNLTDVKNHITPEELGRLQSQLATIISPEATLLKDKLRGAIAQLEAGQDEQLARDVKRIADSNPDYYNKIASSLRVALMELTTGNIGAIIGRARSNALVKRIEDGKRAICVVHLGSLITQEAAFTLGKVIVGMLQSLAGRTFASDRKITPPLCLYIDEAQSVMYPAIEDLFAKGGGAGIMIHGFSQSVNQLFAEVGRDKAQSILANTNSKLFMRVPDPETADYVCGHFGSARRFSSVLSVGGTPTFKEAEDDMLRREDVLFLDKREFYYMSYSGRWKGKTNDVSEAYVDIEFPNPTVEGR